MVLIFSFPFSTFCTYLQFSFESYASFIKLNGTPSLAALRRLNILGTICFFTFGRRRWWAKTLLFLNRFPSVRVSEETFSAYRYLYWNGLSSVFGITLPTVSWSLLLCWCSRPRRKHTVLLQRSLLGAHPFPSCTEGVFLGINPESSLKLLRLSSGNYDCNIQF